MHTGLKVSENIVKRKIKVFVELIFKGWQFKKAYVNQITESIRYLDHSKIFLHSLMEIN